MKLETTKIYTVHIRPSDPNPHETAEFVEENPTLWGFVFGAFWLLYHRVYLAGVVILAMYLAFVVFGDHLGLHIFSIYAINLALRLFVCFDGNDLRRASLKRKGYILTDIVAGESELSAKQRFYERWLASGTLQPTPVHGY